jgi:predicted polyphosphate/ATP-dependent NAD kinase
MAARARDRQAVAPIGIVVNPSSGKDVRRLVARASVFDNREKAAIVRRALAGAVAAGARHFAFMDDSHGIAASVMEELSADLDITPQVTLIECPKTASAIDTERAAEDLCGLACAACLVLGGDGTARAFTRGWRTAPLLAISTGTNNVFPRMIEATVAGAALGLIAAGHVSIGEVARTAKIIDIDIEGEAPDLALIDAVVTDERFIGARALLKSGALRQVFLTRADPAVVGMSALGGLIHPVSEADDEGLMIRTGPGRTVRAPIAPGLYQRVEVAEVGRLAFDTPMTLKGPCVIALDGERERVVKPGQAFSVRLSRTGPLVIDPGKALQVAACRGSFLEPSRTTD